MAEDKQRIDVWAANIMNHEPGDLHRLSTAFIVLSNDEAFPKDKNRDLWAALVAYCRQDPDCQEVEFREEWEGWARLLEGGAQ